MDNARSSASETSGNLVDHGPIPDGGLQAWLQVLGSWVVLAATWGLVSSFGVYQTYNETDLLRTSSTWTALRDPAFLLFVAGFAFVFLCLYTAFFCVQLFDELHGLSSLAFARRTRPRC